MNSDCDESPSGIADLVGTDPVPMTHRSVPSPRSARTPRTPRLPIALALMSCCAAGSIHATTVTWTGAGGDGLWSHSPNWLSGVAPIDGDDIVFGSTGSFQSMLDYSLRTGTFRFTPLATAMSVHVVNGTSGTSSTWSLTGTGIVNDTPFVSGQNLQSFFADAGGGPVGASIVFMNSASISGGSTTLLTASGANVAGNGGGSIVFQDHASTAIDRNFTGVVAEGASVEGGGSGSVVFRDDARAQDTTQLVARGGVGVGAAGGQITVQDRARIESNLSVLNGNGSGGLGGRVDFRGSAVMVRGLLTNAGGSNSQVGAEAVTRFFDNATFAGVAQNGPGGGVGYAAGRVEFHDHSVLANIGTDPSFNSAAIINLGGGLASAQGGRTLFYDDSSTTGTLVSITNTSDGEAIDAGTLGGVTEFHDRSHAGLAMIGNTGAPSVAPPGSALSSGQTLFFDQTSADSATIENFGGHGAGVFGGVTRFSGNATAASATLIIDAGDNGGLGGRVFFQGGASGGRSRIVTDTGGTLDISGLASAGTSVGSMEGGGNLMLGSKRLAIGGNGLTTTFGGVIGDSGESGGGGGSIVKEGTGTLTLAGSNTYTGSTTVNTGGLRIDGTVGGSAVTVNTGATLGGRGTINAPVSIATGATLAPGALLAPGTLTINGDLTLAVGSILNYRMGAPGVVGGPKNDLLGVSGNLTLAGIVNVADSGGFGMGAYRLIDYGGSLVNNGLAVAGVPVGFNAADLNLQTSVAGQVNLIVGGAAVQFWDGSHFTANGIIDGGVGTWNNSLANWTSATGSSNGAWGQRFAVFSGAAGNINVSEAVAATGMQFATNGYTVNATAGGSIALTGAAMVRVDPGATATVNAPLVGAGSLIKSDTGTLTLAGASSYTGGTTVADGVLEVRSASGLGLGSGPVVVLGTATSDLRFTNSASAGTLSISNSGATGFNVGAIHFTDFATAGNANITNSGNTGVDGGGAFIVFNGNSSGGTATIANRGADFSNSTNFGYAQILFTDNSSAANAVVTNFAGSAAGLPGGSTTFSNFATGATGTVVSRGGAFSGASGGVTVFQFNTTADHATLISDGASVAGTAGYGLTAFSGNSTAAQATLIANASTAAAPGGLVEIVSAGSGGSARAIVNGDGGPSSGRFDISGLATTGTTIGSIEGGGRVFLGGKALTVGGNNLDTVFSGGIADGGLIAGVGGSLVKSGAGTLTLTGASSYTGGTTVADGVLVVQNAAGLGLGSGPVTVLGTTTSDLRFTGSGSAGALVIGNSGTNSINVGVTHFEDTATAGSATIINMSNTAVNGGGGFTVFGGNSNAGTATLYTRGAAFTPGGAVGNGDLYFTTNSSAANAALTNFAGLGASLQGGVTYFMLASNAASSTISNRGAAINGALGGLTAFLGTSSAGNSVITNDGGGVNGAGNGITQFYENSTAGAATLIANASSVGAPGGGIVFLGASSGGSARAIVNGNAGPFSGGLDISQLTTTGTTLGSIEGGGIVSLGSKSLTVGSNNLGTTFSGTIRDGGFVASTGGSLAIQGSGALTLSRGNTYSGGTTIGNGVDAGSGKLIVTNLTGSATGSGAVVVDRGGTLSGSGIISGPVTLKAGGTIAPGDPVTLTLGSSLTWDGGGTIRLVLGANSANSDQLNMGSLIRGAAGAYVFNFVDAGVVSGQTYELIHVGSLVGFAANDFTFDGVAGVFDVVGGGLDFTAQVPEPGTLLLFAAGCVLVLRRVRKIQSDR